MWAKGLPKSAKSVRPTTDLARGAHLCVQGGTDRMLEILDAAQGQDVSVSALWIQDWSGQIKTAFGTRVFWNWRWNETWYPLLDVMIQDLDQRRGVKVLGYVTAHLNTAGDVYATAADRDDYWLTKDEESGGGRLLQDFGEFTVATVDLLSPPADCNCLNAGRTWYKQLITENLLGLGFAGWMADFGEYTPTSARSRFGSRWWGPAHSGEILHQGPSAFLLLMAHVVFFIMEAAKQHLFFIQQIILYCI